jgi:hypothetical protein
MDKKIREKLDYYFKKADESIDQRPRPRTPAKPDSLSSVIRTKRESDLFMAQLDAMANLARKEYLESKNKESE